MNEIKTSKWEKIWQNLLAESGCVVYKILASCLKMKILDGLMHQVQNLQFINDNISLHQTQCFFVDLVGCESIVGKFMEVLSLDPDELYSYYDLSCSMIDKFETLDVLDILLMANGVQDIENKDAKEELLAVFNDLLEYCNKRVTVYYS